MLRVRQVIDESPKVKTLVFDSSIVAKPGQYVMLWLPGVDEKPVSIMNALPLKLCVAKVGPFSSKIHEVREGDLLGVRGPFGNGFSQKKAQQVLLVGGGYGVAPLRFLAEKCRAREAAVDVVIGAKTESDVILKNDFEELGCSVFVATEDGSCGEKCLATDLAGKLLNEKQYGCVYSCGPEKMMKKLAGLCEEKQVSCQLSLERFIKCGFGVCGQCACDSLRVCIDGPVFDSRVVMACKDFGVRKRDASGASVSL
ncbi:MAG: dihydroorotate dehydrogenase electron transfer subunit [Candidatus Micrarchaeia archaeon]